MREPGWFLLGFVVGAVAGWAAVIAAYAAYVEVFNVFDRDGGGAMAAAFAIGPMVGLITGLVTGVQVALRRRRRAAATLARGDPLRVRRGAGVPRRIRRCGDGDARRRADTLTAGERVGPAAPAACGDRARDRDSRRLARAAHSRHLTRYL
ncbi:hypothetical protein [Elioraea tepidiphila]|jgi:hypothetical protein|uniref:hypothetical protein n=1 Tax=Elioraea tepidiphila TaxID=457934 RepID=UPI00036B7835|nr:hypothetical protein [Elioraea tepidiphila]